MSIVRYLARSLRSPLAAFRPGSDFAAGRGREALADTFDAADPFALPPAEIVERVLALGNVPDVRVPLLTMWPTIGRVFEVRREEQDFLVAIGRDAEEVSVQEMRADRYLPIE